MIKERLKQMDLRITELADYLHVSRPTMYKLIESYDKKQFKALNNETLQLFNFIKENELVGKRGVITYILNNFSDDTTSDDIEGQVINYLKSNPDSKKSRFIKECVTNETFDKVIYYLADLIPLLNANETDERENSFLAPYRELLSNLNNIKN